MGFGTIVANMMMFIAIMMVGSSLIFIMNMYVQETQDSITEQKNRIVDEIRTSLTIQSMNYNNSELTIYMSNTGTSNIRLETLDLFVDGERVSRDNRTVAIEPDTQIGGLNVWNPKEIVKIETTTTIAGTALIRIVTENGVSDQEVISS